MKLPIPDPLKDLLLLLAMFAVFQPLPDLKNDNAAKDAESSAVIEIDASAPDPKNNSGAGSEGKQSSLSLLINEQGQLIYNNTVLDQAQIQALAEKEATYTVSIALPMPTKQLRELSKKGFNIELQ